MRLITYNVNSITVRATRVLHMLDHLTPDVACLQETKVSPDGFPHLDFRAAGYQAVDHSGGRWAGVAILVRNGLDIEDVRTGLPGQPDPEEARWVEALVGGVRVVSVYVPNGREVGTDTFAAKLDFFDRMADRAAELAETPAVIAGDMNVCPADIDVWNVREVHGATHITPEERTRFGRILEAGYVDAFRALYPDEPGFTWWDYRAGHFHKGFGLRIDLAIASRDIGNRLTSARVERDYRKPTTVPGTKPSDHAPLTIDFG